VNLTLIGGGWTPSAAEAVYGPFLDAAVSRAHGTGRVACVVVDEGDGLAQVERWADVLRGLRPIEPAPVLVPIGSVLDPATLTGTDGLLVCGGLTPAYAAALAPVAPQIRQLVADGVPYAGFSAGAAIAAQPALVGGWRLDGVAVCDEDAGEDLDEVTVVPGLGLVEWPVDVHARQWGTVPRLEAAVRRDGFPVGYAIDEDTAISVTAAGATVIGIGAVHRVTADGTSELPPGTML